MPDLTANIPKDTSAQADTFLSPSLFNGHELQPHHPGPVIHLTGYDYIVGIVLFVSFCTFVWLYAANRKKMEQLVRGFYLNRSGQQLSRDEYSVSNRVGFLLSILFLFVMSLFAGQIVEYYGLNVRMGRTYMYIFLVVGLIATYLTKYLVIRLSGFIFKLGKEAMDYSSAIFVFINILGLFMLPVVTCLEFVREVSPVVFIYAGYFLVLSFLCMRILRGIVIGFGSNRVSKFYLFLYLCTLEIVPIIILVKLFKLYVS
ncbi:MAG TPA: DUF4271 domain-containing protein [Bacteroidia bacterium]